MVGGKALTASQRFLWSVLFKVVEGYMRGPAKIFLRGSKGHPPVQCCTIHPSGERKAPVNYQMISLDHYLYYYFC